MRSASVALLAIVAALAGASLRDCDDAPLTTRLLIVVDGTVSQAKLASQLAKIKKVLWHVEARGAGQPHAYSLVAARRNGGAELLAAFDDAPAGRSIDAIVERLLTLNETNESSADSDTVARLASAWRAAAAHFVSAALSPQRSANGANIALLAVDMVDRLADPTLQLALKELRSRAKIFVLSDGDQSTVTGIERRRVFGAPGDVTGFFEALNKDLDDACFEEKKQMARVLPPLDGAQKCASRRVDLMVMLDTSGSTGGAGEFVRERQLAVDLVEAIEDRAFVDGRLQLGVLRFAVDQMTFLRLSGEQPKAAALAALLAVPFTGRVTRIADALDAAADTLRQDGRADALSVLVLISDGRGQESWAHAAATGRRLRASGVRIFAASAGADASAAELALYAGTGDNKNGGGVFVGNEARRNFVAQVAGLINGCLKGGEVGVASAERDNDAFESKMRGRGVFGDVADPFQAPSILSSASSGIVDADSVSPTNAPMNSSENAVASTVIAPINVTADNSQITVSSEHLKTEKNSFATVFSIETATTVFDSNQSSDAQTATTVFVATTAVANATESDMKLDTVSNETIVGSPVAQVGSDIQAKATDEIVVKSFEFLRNDSSNTESTMITTTTAVGEDAARVFRWSTAAENDFSFDVTEQQLQEREQERQQQFETTATVAADSGEEMARLSRLLQNHQNLSRLPEDCPTDVLFLVDRAPVGVGVGAEPFGEQLDALAALVHRVDVADIAARRVRFALISFAKTAQLEVGLGKAAGDQDELIRQLMDVKPANSGASSFAAAIRLADKEVAKYRRKSARLFVVVLWSGRNGRNTNQELDEALQTMTRWPSSEVYALSLNRAARVDRLAALANGDRWRVFVDGRATQLAAKAGEALISCQLPASGDGPTPDLDGHRPRSDVERVEHLQGAATAFQATSQTTSGCPDHLLDLILVIDTTSRSDADTLRRAALDALRQADLADIGNRIRVGLIRVEEAKASEYLAATAFGLKDDLKLDDALFAVERMALGAPATEKDGRRSFDEILAVDVRSALRPGTRLAFIVLTELSLTDGGEGTAPGRSLLRQLARAFQPPLAAERPAILALSPAADIYGELNGRDARFRMYKDRRLGSGYHRFIKEIRHQLFACRVARIDGASGQSADSPDAVLRDDPGRHGFTGLAERRRTPRPSAQTTDCPLDLIFVIDTSQSIVNEFQRQIQLAVDLVSRLPDADFTRRVRIGIVAFERAARIERPLAGGQPADKSAVLESLRSLRHTGGSTSAVAGIEAAAVEAVKKRPDARLTVILMSDGRTQDEWDRAILAAARLRQSGPDAIYAVTVSHEHFFRELEIYANDKSHVYTDERIGQFLNDAESLLVSCSNPDKQSTSPKSFTATAAAAVGSTLADAVNSNRSVCADDLVDVLFLLDTATSVEKDFLAEKNLLIQLVKALPENDFENRIRVGLITFNAQVDERLALDGGPTTQQGLLDALERVAHVGGQTSLAAGAAAGVDALRRRRAGARLILVLVTDGNSQYVWPAVQAAASRLRGTAVPGGIVYAATLSAKYYADELKKYAGDLSRVFTEARTRDFVNEVRQSITTCGGLSVLNPVAVAAPLKIGGSEFLRQRDAATVAFSQDTAPAKTPSGKCKYTKMDLIVILDASTSRKSVFEQQRELALSLIERLPISRDDTHVATGLNSFTNVPTLRQTLGLGRDRKMVRKAIEDIKYLGGSTLTSKAVELAVQDLDRGRRPDAVQVVVLMNDGMSQDQWDKVLSASAALAATGAERFGVALGQDVDLRELRHYIGQEERIYRDNSTERFLNDVVSLLNGIEKECVYQPQEVPASIRTGDDGFEFQMDACVKPQLDITVLFDQSDRTPNITDPRLNANRYLLLDVLGSLPLETQVRLAIVEFSGRPKLIHRFTDPQDRDSVFERVESIQAVRGRPAYAPAVRVGLDYWAGARRPDARGLLLVVGGGIDAADSAGERQAASEALRRTPDIAVYALDSSKNVEVRGLSAYTGSPKRVYSYERNAEFAKVLTSLAAAGGDCGPKVSPAEEQEEERPESAQLTNAEVAAGSLAAATIGARARDISAWANASDAKLFGGPLDDAQKKIRRPIGATIVPTVNSRVSSSVTPTTTKPTSEGTQLRVTNRPVESATSFTTVPKKSTTNLSTSDKINGSVATTAAKPNLKLSTTVKTTRGTTIRSTTARTIATTKSASPKRTRPVFATSQSSLDAQTNTKGPDTETSKATSTTVKSNLITKPEKFKIFTQASRTTTVAPTRSTVSLSTVINNSSTKPIKSKSAELKANDASRPLSFSSASSIVNRATAPQLLFNADIELAKREDERRFRPGCLVDLIILLDASSSVEPAFEREKALAAGITRLWRIGANNTRVALLKFASAEKFRVIHSFADSQSRTAVLRSLADVPFGVGGVTEIHSALRQTLAEFSPARGARPGVAKPVIIVVTDGFSQEDVNEAARLLRRVVPDVYAVAAVGDQPTAISRQGLETITGDPSRVFTGERVGELHARLSADFPC